MTCCGKTKVNKAKNILTGQVALAIGKEYEFSAGRVRMCRGCDMSTWLTKLEYGVWLFKHGIEVLKHFDDLTTLPMLPKKTTGSTIYCRLCKCEIPAKAKAEDETCPLNKWDK